MSCPICQEPETKDQAPFCSSHCRNIDLVKWIDGKYCISTPIEDPMALSEESDSGEE